MSRKIVLRAAIAIVLIAASGFGVVYLQFNRFIAEPLQQSVNVTIPNGWGLARISRELEQKRVISSARWFRILAKIKKNGFVKAGEYHFLVGQTPVDILNTLKAGRVVQHRLSFPEGLTIKEMVAIMQKAGLPGSKEILKQPDLLKKLKVNAPNLEGWFFPDTYQFTRGDTAQDLITRMVVRSKKILAKEYASRAPDYKLSSYETLILASIIEKETGVASERPLISGVFHNRLRKKMKLQTDPTVIYGIKNFDGNITRKHLKTPTPYNTYTIKGLPPTPISNPGKEAINAAIHPKASSFLYFVARGDGSHAFSTTFKQHNAYVDCYQRKKACNKVK
ncbi:MAG: endolytic transglycosylase MltG [Magnetococcales bacterium]|nr:endolytic transglycosylase MltG [Magnetococcales bacterium]